MRGVHDLSSPPRGTMHFALMSPRPEKAADQPARTDAPFQKAEHRQHRGVPALCFERAVTCARHDEEGSNDDADEGASTQNAVLHDELRPRRHFGAKWITIHPGMVRHISGVAQNPG